MRQQQTHLQECRPSVSVEAQRQRCVLVCCVLTALPRLRFGMHSVQLRLRYLLPPLQPLVRCRVPTLAACLAGSRARPRASAIARPTRTRL
jgi:hypothetical protein